MDSASEDLYFQKLQELIQDEDKIITVSSFAFDFGISIRNSQKLICKYVNDQRKLKPDELAVTYVLTGTLKDNKGKGVLMVKENDLKDKRQLFEDEPYNLIYSVQKSKHIDFNVIALVDMFDSTKIRDEALKGSIVSKNCIKRPLKFKKLPPPRPPALKGKSSFFTPKPGNSAESNKQPESSKNNQKTKPSGGIADLFKTAAIKSNQQTSEKGSVSNSTKSNKQTGKRNGGLAGFLTNGALKPKMLSNCETKKEDEVTNEANSFNKTESQDSVKEEDIVELLEDADFEEEASKHTNEDNNISKKDTMKKNKQARKKQNKRQRDTSEEMPSKKRKRIIERNDSDSDDMFEKEVREEDNEDFIEKSDEEPERILSPVREKPSLPKNKRRKAVTRNYEDEEGFIVTKTEYIYETASEDENEEQKPPKQEKQEKPEKLEKPKTKVSEKKKVAKNQSTLMQFFKKA